VTSRATRITVHVERHAVDEDLLADFVDTECAGLGVDERLRWIDDVTPVADDAPISWVRRITRTVRRQLTYPGVMLKA